MPVGVGTCASFAGALRSTQSLFVAEAAPNPGPECGSEIPRVAVAAPQQACDSEAHPGAAGIGLGEADEGIPRAWECRAGGQACPSRQNQPVRADADPANSRTFTSHATSTRFLRIRFIRAAFLSIPVDYTCFSESRQQAYGYIQGYPGKSSRLAVSPTASAEWRISGEIPADGGRHRTSA